MISRQSLQFMRFPGRAGEPESFTVLLAGSQVRFGGGGGILCGTCQKHFSQLVRRKQIPHTVVICRTAYRIVLTDNVSSDRLDTDGPSRLPS